MRKLGLFFLLFASVQFVFSQNIYSQLMPLEIRQAYQKGTRSLSGSPGSGYWQNQSKYIISTSINTSKNLLTGEETITYFNNSPDTLSKVVIRLYPDLLKKGNARNWTLGADAVNEGTNLHDLKLNNIELDLTDRNLVNRTATNLHVSIPEKLLPNDSLLIEIKWDFIIPTRTVRMGDYGGNRLFIAYWYPQIAVYDDIDGWDEIEYLGTVEYYNDINDFDVTINTPKDFIVWATGTLSNENEVLKKGVVRKLEKARSTDEVLNIVSTEDCINKKVLNSTDGNTWHFSARSVPDFSFALANEVNWDGSSVVVDTNTGRRVFADAVYTKEPRSYQNAAQWSRNVLNYMSFELPGFPFPYEHMTSFSNGKRGGGMESPMMANNGDPVNIPDADATLFHEAAHTYFPFFMGTNERKYAWMDEGWAAFLPIGYIEKYYPDFKYLKNRVRSFENINGKETESTLMTLSYNINAYGSYRTHAYNRPALAYTYLQDALGDSVFKVALRHYMDEWNGKHPTPYDFFNCFVSASGQRLLWFFKPWFFDKAYADLGIKKVTNDNLVIIENYGGLPLPVEITCRFEDGTSENYWHNTSVWGTGESAVIVQVNPDKKIKEVMLGSETIPDIYKLNNVFTIE